MGGAQVFVLLISVLDFREIQEHHPYQIICRWVYTSVYSVFDFKSHVQRKGEKSFFFFNFTLFLSKDKMLAVVTNQSLQQRLMVFNNVENVTSHCQVPRPFQPSVFIPIKLDYI